jgi:hypothetical protein
MFSAHEHFGQEGVIFPPASGDSGGSGPRLIKEYLQPRERALREVVIRGINAGSRPNLHVGKVDSIANLLAAELPGTPTERMSVRIACRTAVWPADTLGTALTTIWGEASGAFELAPLRRRDVLAALEAHGIAVEDFMRALFAAQAVPFAVKPLTLKMLLSIYQQRGDLPNSCIDLYKQGCLALCARGRCRLNSPPTVVTSCTSAQAPRAIRTSPRRRPPTPNDFLASRGPGPVLPATEQSTKDTAFNPQHVGALQRDV